MPELLRPPPPVTWRDRADAAVRAVRTRPWQVAATFLAAAAATAVTLLLVRQPAAPLPVDLPRAPTPGTGTTAPAAEVVVHVAGAVARPGLVRLAAGARTAHAVDAAGGLSDAADVDRLNLAAPLHDGARVYVPVRGQPVPAPVEGDAPADGGRGAGPAAGPLDLNTASAAQLEELPGVGPATAAAIVEHRRRHGRFRSVEGLLDVPGIGEARLARLRPLVRT